MRIYILNLLLMMCCILFLTLLLILYSSDQSTALHEAAYNGHLAVCELLIASKADVKAISRCALKNIYILNLLLILCCMLFFYFASNFLF